MTNGNYSGANTAGKRTTNDGFRFDCPFCDDAIRATTADAVKERSTTHLGDHHPPELLSVFGEMYSGEPCHNDCGHVFSLDDVDEFECPDCGHDNFRPFVRRYLYWQIEAL